MITQSQATYKIKVANVAGSQLPTQITTKMYSKGTVRRHPPI
jgi:hypothetical protein